MTLKDLLIQMSDSINQLAEKHPDGVAVDWVMMPLFGGEGDEWSYLPCQVLHEDVVNGIRYTVHCAVPQDSPADPNKHPYWFAVTADALNSITWDELDRRWSERIDSEDMTE